MTVKAVKDASYHENGTVAFMEINKGRVVVESTGVVDLMYANPGSYDSTGTTFTADTTVAVKVTNNGDVDHAHVVGSGDTGRMNAETVNGNSSGITFDYNNNKEQNTNIDVYHHVSEENREGIASTDTKVTEENYSIEEGKTTVVNNAVVQELVADFWIDVAAESFAGGTGTEADPYQITNGAELARIAKLVNSSSTNAEYSNSNVYYKLMNDIDLSGKAWTPIGNKTYMFSGHFDGNSKTITGLTNYGKNANQLDLVMKTFSSGGTGGAYGLFGYAKNISINNVSFANVNIDSDSFALVGAAIGACEGDNSLINVDTLAGSTIKALKKMGGILGFYYCPADNCTLTLTDCDNAANVTAKEDRAAGIIGAIEGNTGNNNGHDNISVSVTNCSNSGSITASYGGLFIAHIYGLVNTNNAVTLSSCPNTGSGHFTNKGYTKAPLVGYLATNGGMTGIATDGLELSFISCANATKDNVIGTIFNTKVVKIDSQEYTYSDEYTLVEKN